MKRDAFDQVCPDTIVGLVCTVGIVCFALVAVFA